MRFLTPEQWAQAGIDTPGLRFFYERWNELLDTGVPISHRAPVAGGLEILRELIRTHAYYQDLTFGKGGLKALDQEAFGVEVQPYGRIPGTVERDPIAANLAQSLIQQRSAATKHVLVGGSPPQVAGQRTSVAERLIARGLEHSYVPALIVRLRTEIFEAKPTPKSLDVIDALVTALVSELLARGFATSFLRTHARTLERDTRTGSETDRFAAFCTRLIQPVEPIRVVFRVRGSDVLWAKWPDHLSVPAAEPLLPPEAEAPSDWKRFSTAQAQIRFLTFEVPALDHHAATRIAFMEFQRQADLTFVSAPSKEPQILAAATIRPPRSTVALAEGGQLELGYVPIPRSARPSEITTADLARVFESTGISEATKRRLSGALRYYRISSDQNWLESSFTNLWTALEVLASSAYDEQVIERVVRSMVPILASGKIKDLTDDLLGYLLGVQVHRDERFTRQFADMYDDGRIAPHLLLGVLSARERALDLCRLFENRSPLMLRRIMEFHDAVHSGNALGNRVYRTARRLEWQIRRLYRLRNELVHGAALTMNSERLLNHLQSYVYQAVLIEGRVLGADLGMASVEDAVAAIDGAFHAWIDFSRGLDSIADKDSATWRRIYTPAYDTLLQSGEAAATGAY